MRRVYLDNSATTPVDPRVVEAMLPYLTEKFGNASSVHFYGQEARAALDRARREVAALVGAGAHEIGFLSGGTEGNNLARRGFCEADAALGCDLLSLSAHKLYAPKGVGALYVRRSVRLAPLNIGGHQERERRAGTESVPLIVAFGKAAQLARAELDERIEHARTLRDRFE